MGTMLRSDADLGAAASLEAFVGTLRERRLFERGESIAVSRAPGRLDVMGGIADYSGSLVLQRPIREATFVAVERSHERTRWASQRPFEPTAEGLVEEGA